MKFISLNLKEYLHYIYRLITLIVISALLILIIAIISLVFLSTFYLMVMLASQMSTYSLLFIAFIIILYFHKQFQLLLVLYPAFNIIVLFCYLLIVKLLFFSQVVHADTIAPIFVPDESSTSVKIMVGLSVSVGVIIGVVIWYSLKTANPDLDVTLDMTLLTDVVVPLQHYSLDLYNNCLELINASTDQLQNSNQLVVFCLAKIVSFSHEYFSYKQLLQLPPDIQLSESSSNLNQIIRCFAYIYNFEPNETSRNLCQHLGISHILFTHFTPGESILDFVQGKKITNDLYANARIHFHKAITR